MGGGTHCSIVPLAGRDADDPLFPQLKKGHKPATGGRRSRDLVGRADVAGMSPADLTAYARLCGAAPTRARTDPRPH